MQLRLHQFPQLMQNSLRNFGGAVIHLTRVSIDANAGCERMSTSRTIHGPLQAIKRRRTGVSGGNEVSVDCTYFAGGLICNGVTSLGPNSKNPGRSRHKKVRSEEAFESFGAEKELQDGYEGQEAKNPCTEESFCLNYEENDSQRLIKGTESQLISQQVTVMERNESVARANLNREACEKRVAASRAKGLPFPKLEELLVEQTWLDLLLGELQQPYMLNLSNFITREAQGGIPIYPPPALVFNALNTCPFDKVKVVILGQDPYHGRGQAMGLCFSVPKGIKIPSSLVNIFKEIQQDVGCSLPSHGNLQKWATQGVLLLNTVLTVREHQANSHAGKGWEQLTDSVIRAISLKKSAVIFILWGNSAQKKIRLINTNNHHILKAAHPSGLSAYKGFFNCRHFSQTNKILQQLGLSPIDWQI